MDGMLKNFVWIVVIMGLLAVGYYYCDKEDIDICFPTGETEWCILKNDKDED